MLQWKATGLRIYGQKKKMDSIGEKAVDIHVGDSEIGVFGSGWGMNIAKIHRRTKFIK